MDLFKLGTLILSKKSHVNHLVFTLSENKEVIVSKVNNKLFTPTARIIAENEKVLSGERRHRLERKMLWEEIHTSIFNLLVEKEYPSIHVSVAHKDDCVIVSYTSPELRTEIATFKISLILSFTGNFFSEVKVLVDGIKTQKELKSEDHIWRHITHFSRQNEKWEKWYHDRFFHKVDTKLINSHLFRK